jgi:hypothetical protein
LEGIFAPSRGPHNLVERQQINYKQQGCALRGAGWLQAARQFLINSSGFRRSSSLTINSSSLLEIDALLSKESA